jgi:hypothetical protein
MRKILNREQVCASFFEKNQWPIRLLQSSPDNFTVVYGKQVTKGLTYGAAASELGSCIMHFLACEGKLDNSKKGKQ